MSIGWADELDDRGWISAFGGLRTQSFEPERRRSGRLSTNTDGIRSGHTRAKGLELKSDTSFPNQALRPRRSSGHRLRP